MALLAQQPHEPATVHDLAIKGQIPAPYLAKLLQGLVHGGLVRSQRGVRGGYTLARDPASITLADIVNHVEPLQRIRRCPLGLPGHIQLCPLHRRLDQAMAQVEAAFRETTLADLFRDARAPTPLCDADAALPRQPPRGQRGPRS
jgi:Rrf2 family protein